MFIKFRKMEFPILASNLGVIGMKSMEQAYFYMDQHHLRLEVQILRSFYGWQGNMLTNPNLAFKRDALKRAP